MWNSLISQFRTLKVPAKKPLSSQRFPFFQPKLNNLPVRMIVVSAVQPFPNSGISSLSWSAASTWRVPHCQQAGVFSLPFYEPRLAESVFRSASNSAGVEVTRSRIESFAPDILRIFPHRGCRDWNVQKWEDGMTETGDGLGARMQNTERRCPGSCFDVAVFSGICSS